MPRLTKTQIREEKFARHYLSTLNATKAAELSGYKPTHANVAGARLIVKDSVQALITKLRDKRMEELDVNAYRVLKELSHLAFSNMQDYIRIEDGEAYVDLSNLSREQAAAIQEITSEVYVDGYVGTGEDRQPINVKRTKFKLSDKRGSLELLGKYLALFQENHTISGPDGGPVSVRVIFDIAQQRPQPQLNRENP